ncbi:MAG: aromatic ring-hydroxylating dioxygenase subunit alpha [Solirubrobacterales bacterium]|nr:aromatic ring-hydroxylating dioxygenase subunit alpha [Solirubrobacterales bacterium]
MTNRIDSGSGDVFTREETYAATRRPVALAETLVPDAYTSDAFLALERERVFASSWVAVGCSATLREPGDALVADVAGRSVVVVRADDGALGAYYNVCRHRGTRLVTADTTRVGRYLRCPYHSWAYDREGRCVGTPLFAGSDIPADQRAAFETADVAAFHRADYGLLPVAVDEWGPLVFLNLDGGAGPLAEHLGDLERRTAGYRLPELELARTGEYEIAANYKLIAENFMEYYHLPWIHPGLVKVSPIEAHHRWQGAGMYCGFCTSPIAPDTEDGGWQSGLAPLDGLDASDATSARFAWIFPNVAINVLPNHVFVILARPLSPRLTHETTYLLTPRGTTGGGDAESAVDGLARFWDGVNREDIGIVERVQAGLDSTPFPGGRLCYRFEEPLHRFQNMVADRMVGRRRVPPGDDVQSVPMFGARAS